MDTVLISDQKVLELDLEASDVAPDWDAELLETTARAPEEVVEAAEGADALVLDADTRVTREVLAALDLAIVARAGIGVDNIDLAAAADLDVPVVNVPDYCLDEVSTHAVGLALACRQRIGRYDRTVKAGGWDWAVGRPIPRLAGSTVGLVAFGKIARRVAAKLRGFDVDVIAYDPYVADYRMHDLGVERVGFEELLARSDVCSIHAPLTDETRGMFDAEAFDAMPEGAILVNTARGPIVDEAALRDALEDGPLAGAGLDVREDEPPGDSPLHDRDDVLLTPHVAWYSEASRLQLARTVLGDVARVLDGEAPENPADPETGWF